MANSWFRFKQFTVTQQLSAMKVSTDACIQGAWTATFINSHNNKCNKGIDILDIGCGTGLLSLMLAQELPDATITAIDTDAAAAGEAGINFLNSPWEQRLCAKHIALQKYRPDREYDYIICNPPFFHRHLQADGPARNIARHDITLSKSDLANYAAVLLKTSGYISVMFPANEWDGWMDAAIAKSLMAHTVLHIFPGEDKEANRIVGIFSKTAPQQQESYKLIIRTGNNTYSPEFIKLMRPYYLYL